MPNDDFYADDLDAEAIADNNLDPDMLILDEDEEDDDLGLDLDGFHDPVTTGEMEIGDLDDDAMLGQGGEDSYDEESVPGTDDLDD